MTEVKSRILKTENVKWKDLKIIQPSGFKDLSKDAYAKLRQSIITNNFIDPFKVWENCENLYVVDGVHRIKVLNELEKEGHIIPQEFPANFILCANRKEAAKLVLIYSSIFARIQEESLYEFLHTEELDFEELKLEIDLPELDLDRFEDGWMRDTKEDDFDVEQAIGKPKYDVKMGDVFILKNHRLMCGDSTKREDVKRLMNGQKADIIFTDPPYGMDLDSGMSNITNPKDKWINKAKNYSSVIGDDKDYNPAHLFTMFPDVKEMFLWGADYYSERLQDKNKGSFFVWDKRVGLEEVEYSNSSFELCWSKEKHRRDIVRVKWFGLAGTETQDIKKRIHPTQKPIELCVWFINKFSQAEQKIVDLFGGSGSTLIACEQTNRICYMMEIDLLYISVIIERFIKYIGTDAHVCRINNDGSKTPITELEIKEDACAFST